MTAPVHHTRAKQDAEWLAGSEADTAERNLARAYLALTQRPGDILSDEWWAKETAALAAAEQGGG